MSHPRIFMAQGVVLRRRNLGEADRIVTIFTQHHGKIQVLAKGIRKLTSRRGPHVDVFCVSKFVIAHGKTFDILTEAQSLERHENLRTQMEKVSLAYYVCELVDRLLPQGQEHAAVYDLLVRTLGSITYEQTESTLGQKIVYRFALDLLDMLGYLPTQEPTAETIARYIESIIERKLHSPLLLTRIH